MKLNTKNVKTWLLACGFGLFATGMYAQAPQKFNYQGIARDLKGNPMGKQQLGLKISVLPTEDATQPEYEETQLVS
ncbi:MAG TPA: hypothetical protein PLP14_07440, partial [Chitinophagaceae bacterium]|nr:hypothetical protein [Chitinophagaceae bacterium]